MDVSQDTSVAGLLAFLGCEMAWNPIDDPTLRRWDARANPPVEREDKTPLRLHVNQPCEMSGYRERLGSQEWSRDFYRFMSLAFEQAVDQAMGQVHWWQVPYILSRLGQDETINRQHLGALLAFRVGHVSWQVALEQFQCRAVYVKRLEQSIKRIYRAFC